MPKPICVPCQRFFRMKRSGYYFTEGMPVHNEAAAGTAEPEGWRPYKLWSGDLYECQGCGAQIISGFGHGPIAIQHHDNFEALRVELGANRLQVNDC